MKFIAPVLFATIASVISASAFALPQIGDFLEVTTESTENGVVTDRVEERYEYTAFDAVTGSYTLQNLITWFDGSKDTWMGTQTVREISDLQAKQKRIVQNCAQDQGTSETVTLQSGQTLAGCKVTIAIPDGRQHIITYAEVPLLQYVREEGIIPISGGGERRVVTEITDFNVH